MKRLLIIAFVFYSTSLSFASSSETLFLQCPLVVNKLVEKVKAQPGSDFEKYGTKGTISEMRFFKLKIKKFDAHLTIHSAFIYNETSVPLDYFWDDKLSEEETDIKNNIFKYNYADENLVDNGTISINGSNINVEGIIWYRNINETIIKYSHNSDCQKLDKKSYKEGIKGKYLVKRYKLTGERLITINWKGYSNLIVGSVKFRESNYKGTVYIKLPNADGTCEGSYSLQANGKGIWQINCTNNMKASGSLKWKRNGLVTGKGKDHKNKKVKFEISKSS